MITTHTRVLLIEDNPDDARLIQLMLRKTGLAQFQVTVTDRLAAGHDYLAQHAVDVILLDMSLPDGRGLEALKRTLASAPGAPVLVLTGLDDYDTGRAAIGLGAQDYLIKDRIDGDLLARAISYAVERKHATDQLRLQAAILAQVQDAVITTDLNFVIRTWNHAAETIYGWRADEAIGKPLSTLLQTFFPGSPREVIVEELMVQGTWQGEVVHRRKDNAGVRRFRHADPRQQRPTSGDVSTVISRRMQAEQSARE
jgi:PAS domain S-box-containing protein